MVVILIAVPTAAIQLPAIVSTAYFAIRRERETTGWIVYNGLVGGATFLVGGSWMVQTLGRSNPGTLDYAIPGTLVVLGGVEAGYALYSLLGGDWGKGGRDTGLRFGLAPGALALSGRF